MKPDIHWLEGLLVYFEISFPHEISDPRRVGFEIGQRIIGLYLSEMLLKYSLDKNNEKYPNTHSLLRLFKKLPPEKTKAANHKYREILNNRVESTWTFARSLILLVKELGENPIKDTRYFWHTNYNSGPHIISPSVIYPLVYSLFIVLHNYPQKSKRIEKRYKTQFVDFEKTLKYSAKNTEAKDDGIGMHNVVWMEGLLDYFNAEFPFDNDDPRSIGFAVGRQIIGLHIVELLLKYKLDELKITYEHDHNLALLYRSIPKGLRDGSERKYREILSSFALEAWEHAKSIESLLQYYGPRAITDSRYFWEPADHREGPMSIVFDSGTLYSLVYAFFITLHGYPEAGSPVKKYETKFIPLEDPEALPLQEDV